MAFFKRNKSGYKVFKEGDKYQSVHKRVVGKKWVVRSEKDMKSITKTEIKITTAPATLWRYPEANTGKFTEKRVNTAKNHPFFTTRSLTLYLLPIPY